MSANEEQIGGNHYRDQAIQPWDYIASNGLGYFEGNIVKYVSRWKQKGGIEDLRKARHYLDKLIETVPQMTQAAPAPVADKLPLLPIVVGGVYRRRDGKVVTIECDDGTQTPFMSSDAYWYMPDGNVRTGNLGNHPLDLVERIS